MTNAIEIKREGRNGLTAMHWNADHGADIEPTEPIASGMGGG
jgi:hypothetical protein